MKIFTVVLAVFLLGACSTLRDIAIERGVPEKTAKAVDTYCNEVPEAERLKNREQVNALTEQCDIYIVPDGALPLPE